ncbi:hypothetical protein LL946_08725 [Knoellia locipacati]|uniref:hypothetical protein n=1 Tax=Knoellia locipacati TaxID=882824 RepID=UPI003850FF76
MTTATRHQLSLSDIARLAGVQRPVVSMWRRRPLAGHVFPPPVGRVGGEERFDADKVVAYLTATSRGNNPEAADDLAAHSQLAQLTDLDEVVAVQGLTALLCLAAAHDEPLADLSERDLLALVREVDPDDTFLAREVVALGPDLSRLANHADDLASASYSAEAAVERILRRHAAAVHPGVTATALDPVARALVARTAAALAADATDGVPLFVDVTDSAADLLLAVENLYAGELAPSVATLALDTPTARLARRRLRIHDVHRIDVLTDKVGDFSLKGGASDVAVHVLQLPPAGDPGLSDLDVLDVVGDLLVQLDDTSRVVVIGPASALTDRPRTAEVDRARDAVLRSDRLRAAVRLPKGLVVHSPRRPLALWAFGPAHPQVAVRDRWTVVADVGHDVLDEAMLEGLVTDVVAAMRPDERSAKDGDVLGLVGADTAQVVGHQFRFGRRVATSQLVVGRRSLVDVTSVRPRIDVHEVPGMELASVVRRLIDDLASESLAGLHIEATPTAGTASRHASTTGARAVADGLLRVLPGNRIEAADLSSSPEGLAVLGRDEVLGRITRGGRRIALTTLATRYPSGRLTEPGDVVMCTSPRVGALVDAEGGSVVQSPARVLRITEAGRRRLLPSLLAADVNGPATQRVSEWQRWPLRLLPPDASEALALATAALDRERDALLARLTTLDQLVATVTDGVAQGTLTISMKGL